MKPRRSERKRVSRYVKVDGYSILKLNNYSLEEGEQSVYKHEARASAPIHVPKTKNAYQLFSAAFKQDIRTVGNFASTQKKIAAAWRALAQPERAQFQEQAAKLAKEREEKLQALCARQKQQYNQEQHQEQQQQPRRRKRVKKSAASEKKSKSKRRRCAVSTTELRRLAYNKSMAAERKKLERSHLAFFSRFKGQLRPFVSQKVLRSFKALREDEITAATDAGVDVNGPPTQSQPKCIVGGKMRDYQLKSLEWLLALHEQGVSAILGDEMGLGKTLQTIADLCQKGAGVDPDRLVICIRATCCAFLHSQFLSVLKYEQKKEGVYLCVVPLSVMSSWMNEFRRWSPKLRIFRVHAEGAAERTRLRKQICDVDSYDVVLTTYETLIVPELRATFSQRVAWRVVVLDEGHRVKNEESRVSKSVRKLHATSVLLLTGTPLQNNLHELWAILNYLHPSIFTVMEPFDEAFELGVKTISIDRKTLDSAHHLLRPLMLRRLKTEVEKLLPPRYEIKISCPLSPMQLFWYKRLLFKDSKLLDRMSAKQRGMVEGESSAGDWKRLLSLMTNLRSDGVYAQYACVSHVNTLGLAPQPDPSCTHYFHRRKLQPSSFTHTHIHNDPTSKCCNHPFLFNGAEATMRDVMQSECDDSIIRASGKMETLMRLLRRLKAKGHRVVLFSQFTRFLDIVDDFLNMSGYSFVRLDGSTNRVQRMVNIQAFNKPNSPHFIFLMSTRAGGLGVNLWSADTVILMDSDWNPQVDLQAMARVHRIGQKNVVHVYRLVSNGTMEERMVQRAQKKLFLDAMVNRGSTANGMSMDKLDAGEMLKVLSFGMDALFTSGSAAASSNEITDPTQAPSVVYASDAELDRIIDRSIPRAGKKQAPTTEPATSAQSEGDETASGLKSTLADFDETVQFTKLREFGGVNYERKQDGTSLGSMKEIAQQWAKKIGPRKRKSRFTVVDGHTVLKQNMYSLQDGEPSVFENETKTADTAAMSQNMFVSRTQRAGRDYSHQDWCQACGDGGRLILCDYCPCAYHLSCLDVDEVPNLNWSCPHHQCHTCGRKSNAVGGLLFRCEVCPKAFCEDHLPQIGRDNITNTCQRFVELGQFHPKQACFMLCSDACIKYRATINGGRDPTADFANTRAAAPIITPPSPKDDDGNNRDKHVDSQDVVLAEDTTAKTSVSAINKVEKVAPCRRSRRVARRVAAKKKKRNGGKPVKATKITTTSAATTLLQSSWGRLQFLGFPKNNLFTERRLKELINIAAESHVEPLTLEQAVPNLVSEMAAEPNCADYLKTVLQALGKPGVPLGLWAGSSLSSSSGFRARRDKIAALVLQLMTILDSKVTEGGANPYICMKLASLFFGLRKAADKTRHKRLALSLFLAFPCPFFKSWTERAWVATKAPLRSRRFRQEVKSLRDGVAKNHRQFNEAVAERKRMREERASEARASEGRNDTLVHNALEVITNMIPLGWKVVVYEAQRGARSGIAQVQLIRHVHAGALNIEEAVQQQLMQAHQDIHEYFRSQELKSFAENAAATTMCFVADRTTKAATKLTLDRVWQHLVDYLHGDVTGKSATCCPFPVPDRLRQLRRARFGLFRRSSKSSSQMVSDLGLETQTRDAGVSTKHFTESWKFPVACLGNAEVLRIRELLIKGGDIPWADVLHTLQIRFNVLDLRELGYLVRNLTKNSFSGHKTLTEVMTRLIHNNLVSSVEREVAIKGLVAFIDKSQIQQKPKVESRRWRVIRMDTSGPSLVFTSRDDCVLLPREFTFTTKRRTTDKDVQTWGKAPKEKPYQYLVSVSSREKEMSPIQDHAENVSGNARDKVGCDCILDEPSPHCVSDITVARQIRPHQKKKISDGGLRVRRGGRDTSDGCNDNVSSHEDNGSDESYSGSDESYRESENESESEE